MSLIKSISTFKNYVKVNINSELKTLQPAIDEAEKRYIIPAISKALYDVLHEYVNDGGSSSEPALDSLLPQVERPLANLAYWLHISPGNVVMDDAGLHKLSNDHFKPASTSDLASLDEHFSTIGFDAIDDLLEFLEENKDDYEDWVASDSYTEFHSLFIRNAKEFKLINNSRRTFLALRDNLEYIQDTHIKSLLGDDYQTLLDALIEDDLTEEQETLLNTVRKAMRYLTIAEATKELSLIPRHTGFMLSAYDGGLNDPKRISPAERDRLSTLQQSMQQKGNQYLKNLEDLLSDDEETDTDNNYFDNETDNKSYFT